MHTTIVAANTSSSSLTFVISDRAGVPGVAAAAAAVALLAWAACCSSQIGEAKVAALGVHIAHGVATHGFGLNVDERPLPFFEHIVPCGLERPVTCVAHHLPDNMCNDGGHEGGGGGPDAAGLLMSRVQEEVVAQFVSRFQYSAVTWATLTVAEALAAACTATADTATEEDGWGGGAADGHDGVYRARCALGMEAGTALQSSPPRP
eukprot:COSAG01_NODE_2344_length_7864_cov_3.341790_2_plen_206_part_00